MTTIAYKEGVLAADTQLTLDNTKMPCHKILRLPQGGVLACAGNMDHTTDFEQFMSGTRTKCKAKKFEAIYVDAKKHIWWYLNNPEQAEPVEGSCYAIGSGWKIAMAGMLTGLSAIDAVKLAGQLDLNTNTEVDHYVVKTGRLHQVTFH